MHGGRSFVKTLVSHQVDPTTLATKREKSRGLIVLSYNVYCDTLCKKLRYSSSKNWNKRCVVLMEEIKSYDADIICFQNLDHFDDWWRVQLMVAGYDSMFKKRTQKRESHYEGVAIAYKRDLFQLFKSVPINLNKASELDSARAEGVNERLICDDVALLLFLQPWKPDFIESAILIGTIQFASRESDTRLRFFQAEYFTKQIELANREFHLPCVIGASLYDSPNSPAYHVLRTGRTQLKPNPPAKVRQPFGKGYCRGSVRLQWYPPKVNPSDPPVHSYRIAWRPGGSLTLGFRAQITVPVGSALQYGEKINALGVKKSYVMDELAFNIVGLSSELPFEFIVAAINDEGQGQWSDPSTPIVMENPPNNPRQPALKYLSDVTEVGALREVFTMGSNDWDVEIAISSDPVASKTQLTPRLISGIRDTLVPRGKAMPSSVNPREGWREDLGGQSDVRVTTELASIKNIYNTVLRGGDDRDPAIFNPAFTDSPRSKRAIVPEDFALTPFDHLGRPRWNQRLLGDVNCDSHDVDDAMSEISGPLRLGMDEDDGDMNEEEKSFASARSHHSNTSKASASIIHDMQLVERGVNVTNSTHAPPARGKRGDSPSSDLEEADRRGAIFERVTTLDAKLNPDDEASEGGFESKASDRDGDSSRSSMGEQKLRLHGEFLRMRAAEREKAALEAELAAATANNLAGLRDPSRDARRLNDDTVLDGAELVKSVGRPDPRQKHTLGLRSAYESYSAGGEPLFTTSWPSDGDVPGVACVDFLFYSGHQMVVVDVLSLPLLNQLRGDNPQKTLTYGDPYCQRPPQICKGLYNNHFEIQAKVLGAKSASSTSFSKNQIAEAKRLLHAALEKSLTAGGYEDPVPGKVLPPDVKPKERPKRDTFWGGVWMPNPTYNPQRSHAWLPNDVFASSHMAIGCRLDFIEGTVAAVWR